MGHKSWLLTMGLATVAAGAADAYATDNPADSANSPIPLEEIVVTAQKREERLIDAPVSVTALSGSALEKLNAQQFADFATSVPGLSFTSSGLGQAQVTLRGVTAGHDIGPTVGIYVDDVPYGSSSAFSNASSLALDVGIHDLERIEVLRGPQGTLYGASTMGGLLKYVTIKPDLQGFESIVRSGMSNTDRGGLNYDGSLTLNAPLIAGKAALRATGYYSHETGYIDNAGLGDRNVGRSRVYGGRVDSVIQPTESLQVRLVGFAQNIDRQGSPTVDYALSGRPLGGPLDQARLFSEPFTQQFRLGSATVTYDAGFAELTSITSEQSSEVTFVQDASAVYVPALGGFGIALGRAAIDQGRSVHKFTQELRLGAQTNSVLEWLVGGFYTHETSGNMQISQEYDPTGAVFPLHLASVSIPSRYDEAAAFGDLTLHVGSFSGSGGLRYAANKQRFEQIGTGLLVGSTPATNANDHVTTYLGNLSYRFGAHATAYLRYATGYRPGGPNFVVTDPGTGAPLDKALFQADTLTSYELGIKAQTPDGRLGIDLATYQINWRNIQVSSAAGGVSIIANAGRARIDGGELTLTAHPAANFTASGAFAYQNARLSDASVDLGAAAGERLPNVPKFTAAVQMDYSLPFASQWRPTAGATFRYVDARTASFDGSAGYPQYHLPTYATLDLRTGLSIHSIDLQVYAHNLFDRRGQISAETFFGAYGGPAEVTLIQPRTVGISATAQF